MVSYNEMNNTTGALQNLNYKNCPLIGNICIQMIYIKNITRHLYNELQFTIYSEYQ